jgi:uncharacterized RDD family membrane protein YckC
MSTDDAYINQVIGRLPRSLPLRSQVAMELRSHIAERVEHGQSVDDALQQLGDPVALAESYLAAIPLVAGSFWERAAAKILDLVAFAAAYLPIAWLASRLVPPFFVVIAALALFAGGFCLSTAVAEYRFGTTIGKHLLGLRVVRESGAGISFGQSVVRQLPAFLQVGWIDVLFALFTDRRQRAFELLSKTRVVRAPEEQSAIANR